MTTLRTWVLGAGGQARETRDLIESVGRDELGRELAFAGLIGPEEEPALSGEQGALVLGFGFPELRARLFGRFASSFDFPKLVHPGAEIGSRSRLAEGVVVSTGCVVTTDVQLGVGTLLNPRSAVGHDSVLGDFCVVNWGVNLSGAVMVGDRVLVGSGATVLQGVSIGDDAIVGAGAVVTKDVPAGTTVVGNPAMPMESRGSL